MKHTTQMLYGISPQELKEMTYEDALIACQNGAKNRLRELIQYGFMDRDEALVIDINKALEWCNAKLLELEELK